MPDMKQNPRSEPGSNGLYQTLQTAEPAARTRLALAVLGAHPDGRLELGASEGQRPMLDGINLSPDHLREQFQAGGTRPRWWHDRQAIDLRRADLRGASLRKANLQHAVLEEADLADADLAGAHLQGANLSEANLQGVLLEDADLRKAVLRFAHARGSVLEGAQLQGADLWGIDMQTADLCGADLQGAVLEEANLEGADLSHTDLRGAVLRRANLKDANLTGADLRGALLGGANLQAATLCDAQVQELELTGCNLTHVRTCGSRLERTRLDQDQLGGAIGEEVHAEYGRARKGYLVLERNFYDLGDHDAGRWAYLRRRRMEKWEALHHARAAWSQRHRLSAARAALKYFGDTLVEWVCNYGESVSRVLGTFVAVYLLFMLLYGVTGTVLRVQLAPEGAISTPTTHLADLAIFSLMTMASPGNRPDHLLAASEFGYLLSGAQTVLSIFLIGLMGFVAGNRIRR